MIIQRLPYATYAFPILSYGMSTRFKTLVQKLSRLRGVALQTLASTMTPGNVIRVSFKRFYSKRPLIMISNNTTLIKAGNKAIALRIMKFKESSHPILKITCKMD